jgi:hypothetical protein
MWWNVFRQYSVRNVPMDVVEISTRRLPARAFNSHDPVRHKLQEQQLHPYNFQFMQDSLPYDTLARYAFRQWVCKTQPKALPLQKRFIHEPIVPH